jgi:OOP family OmpA-OmpF porin
MLKPVAFLVALLFLAVVPAGSHAGGYVGAGIGASFIKVEPRDLEVQDFNLEGSDFAYKLFGGWRPMPFVALEGGYRDLGKISDKAGDIVVEADMSGWDVEAMGVLPLGTAHVFVKAGYFFWKSEASAGSNAASDDGTDFMWGMGADLSFLLIALRAEWERLEVGDAGHVSMFSAGVTLGF